MGASRCGMHLPWSSSKPAIRLMKEAKSMQQRSDLMATCTQAAKTRYFNLHTICQHLNQVRLHTSKPSHYCSLFRVILQFCIIQLSLTAAMHGFLVSALLQSPFSFKWHACSIRQAYKTIEIAKQCFCCCSILLKDSTILMVSCLQQLVRRWKLGVLSPAEGSAIYGHNYPVRALSAGPLETLLSADSSGEVAVWKV